MRKIPNSEKGLIENGASNLSRSSNFMQLTQAIQPSSNVVYHSIMGNINGTTDKSKNERWDCAVSKFTFGWGAVGADY